MNEELRSDILQADLESQYDSHCKTVLASKTILAWILRHTMLEFSDFTLEEIQNCIEETEISPDYVPARRRAEKIMGLANESNIPGEGAISYDIRLAVYLPQGAERRKIYVNIEGQKDFHPGYHIWSRGIYYVSRMVSSQKGVDFSGEDYDSIRKVYSIWICMNAPAYIGNAISEVSMAKRDIAPGIPNQEEFYDKMSIVQITLNEEKENPCSLTGMLNVLFSMNLRGKQKIQVLQEDYHIDLDTDLERKVNTMSNLGEYAVEYGYRKGMQQGMQQGILQGKEQGVQTGQDQLILSMLRNHVSPEEISHITSLPLERIHRAATAANRG
ncbi:MAG: hypothetical protein LUE63_04680 [Lachnospiraceae bacterium]|nr:hypothetical protein [Lachnospiraceae bacterium]